MGLTLREDAMGDTTRRKKGPPSKGGVSRRGFLTSAGIGAVGFAAGRGAAAPPAAPAAGTAASAADTLPVALRVNGRVHRLLVEPRWSLLFVLREKLGLTGAKAGCERGECGTCTVLIGGKPRYACLTLAVEAGGAEITTVEGLMEGERLGPVQRAFAEQDAFQCGYCTPGQILAAEGLLGIDPDPSPDAIRVGMSGNLCRCGAYPNIVKAVRRAAELKKQPGGRP
jgi:xanthine dehydrogenase YagT iron-sulfur-binding subunit